MKKNIFLLWLQGWQNAAWLQKQVLLSWQINNPKWNIELIDQNNLKEYVNDIDYIYDVRKKITPQAKSDIIRLSILKNYGGVWADSTLLCMQPLDHWVFDAIKSSNLWMYHGHGGGLSSDLGPASWFIVSEKNSFLINRWKISCDIFWSENHEAKEYFWMDGLFKELIKKDKKFKNEWLKTPFLYCEEIGSSHTLANYNNRMEKNSSKVKELLKNKPPYVLKLSSKFQMIFPSLNAEYFKKSNANFAIVMSTRKLIYKHVFVKPIFIKNPIKIRFRIFRLFLRIIKIFINPVMLRKIDY